MNFTFQFILVFLMLVGNSFASEINSDYSTLNNVNSLNNSIKITNKSALEDENLSFAVNVHGVVRDGVRELDKTYTHTRDGFETPTLVAENTRSNLRPFSLAWNQDMSTIYLSLIHI